MPRRTDHKRRITRIGCMLVLAATPILACSRGTPGAQTEMESRFGVKMLDVRLNAQSYLVDARYQVTDPKKATSLLAADAKPKLIDELTGDSLYVPNFPKVGTLRTKGRPEEGRQYFVLFGNSRGVVQAGHRVTLTIGDFKVEHLAVR
jgi:hypothetical protein